jgi:hypothetical protein
VFSLVVVPSVAFVLAADVPVTLVFDVSAVAFVLVAGVHVTSIGAARAGILLPDSLVTTAAAAEQAINQSHHAILPSPMLRAAFSANVPSLPGRKLEGSLDRTMSGPDSRPRARSSVTG